MAPPLPQSRLTPTLAEVAGADWVTPRPLDETYWVVPRRLLVGAHPGSRSRAQAMDRLKRFLEAGVTCFIDLTEPHEAAGYESLLPFETPAGRRVEYLREPIVDHGVPQQREAMARVLAMLDGALDSGHVVYLHCRAGIGRSAMALGCWLAERRGGDEALRLLLELWQPAVQSGVYPRLPETDEQADYVRSWAPTPARRAAQVALAAAPGSGDDRLRGAWFGLALGDALGAAHLLELDAGAPLGWTQHTALALCLHDSLLAKGRCDARDQIERYLRWQRAGYCTPDGQPPAEEAVATEVSRALATYQWRKLPMAGSHDPRDLTAASLPRVLAAAAHAVADPVAAVNLAAECSRTTHQSPAVLDACRLYGATLVAGMQGQPDIAWLRGLPQTEPSCWGSKPLHKDIKAAAERTQAAPAHGERNNVARALSEARRIALDADDFAGALAQACRSGGDQAALYGALVGTLFGLRRGMAALPAAELDRLQGAALIDERLQRPVASGRVPQEGA